MEKEKPKGYIDGSMASSDSKNIDVPGAERDTVIGTLWHPFGKRYDIKQLSWVGENTVEQDITDMDDEERIAYMCNNDDEEPLDEAFEDSINKEELRKRQNRKIAELLQGIGMLGNIPAERARNLIAIYDILEDYQYFNEIYGMDDKMLKLLNDGLKDNTNSFLKSLNDPRPIIKGPALFVLGIMGVKSEQIINKLMDNDEEVRYSALWALHLNQDSNALPEILIYKNKYGNTLSKKLLGFVEMLEKELSELSNHA